MTFLVAVKLKIVRITVEFLKLVVYLYGVVYVGMLDTERWILIQWLFGIDVSLSSVTVAWLDVIMKQVDINNLCRQINSWMQTTKRN